MKTIVVAYDQLRTIGRDGALPWQGKLPADMAHFKEVTEGTSTIMGRATWDSLPERFKPLANRQNIVLSLSLTAIKGVQIARSLEEAYELAELEPTVIGGAKVYQEALATIDRVIATEIWTETEGGDAFFPALPRSEWRVDSAVDHLPDKKNNYYHSFITYVRRNPEFLDTNE